MLVSFKAGQLFRDGKLLHADPRKGTLTIEKVLVGVVVFQLRNRLLAVVLC